MISRVATFAFISLFASGGISGAIAEKIPDHPRINEVNQRVAIQQHRIAEGVARGQIGRWRAEHDMRRDERIERQLSRDEAMHEGHISLGEQVLLNQELDRNSVHIHDQRHDANDAHIHDPRHDANDARSVPMFEIGR